jgi:hypothetical protein
MSPAPALLSAYMGSKWAGEAYIQVLRMEMQLRNIRIDGSMISPGFIKVCEVWEWRQGGVDGVGCVVGCWGGGVCGCVGWLGGSVGGSVGRCLVLSGEW